jgi:hypothetical protein
MVMETVMWSAVLMSGGAGAPETANGVTVIGVDDPVSLTDHFAAAVQNDHPIVVGIPQALAAPARTALTIAQGQQPAARVAWFVSDHGPLGIFAGLASSRAHTPDPGLGVSTVHALLEITWSAAVVSSVASLAAPSPTVSQHLMSYAPGSSFLVRHAPEPAVLNARAGLRASALALPPTNMPRVLLSAASTPSGVVSAVQQAGNPAAVRQFDVPGSWTEVYGSGGSHQLVLLPDVTHLAPRPLRGCRSCGLHVSFAVCPFCQVRTAPAVPTGAYVGAEPLADSSGGPR